MIVASYFESHRSQRRKRALFNFKLTNSVKDVQTFLPEKRLSVLVTRSVYLTLT